MEDSEGDRESVLSTEKDMPKFTKNYKENRCKKEKKEES